VDHEWSSDLTVVDAAGRVLLSPSCGAPVGLGPRQLERAATTTASFRLGGEGADYGGYAPVGVNGWVAVMRRSDSLRGPIGRLFRNYWLFVLGLATVTVLAFSMLVGRVTRSIEDLTRAAERVGRGDLRPWLPPPATDEVGRLTLAFGQMTDRLRDTLERVDRSGRLAVVGKLSSYLAHEIRNPLSAVKMNLQRLDRWQRRGELSERCREPIRMSLQEVERLQAAVANVLQLSRAPDQPPEIVSLHGLVTEAGELLDKELAQRGVELRWELDAEADRVLARPGQLKGVILNLILNAMDAQPEGGRLLIRSRLSPGTPGRPGPRLELRFLDDGPGVPPEIRTRVFEPFFTTKPKGSGIGLAVASQAVKENGGDLFLDEPLTVDQGAEFVVSLPLAAVSPDDEALEDEPELAAWLAEAPGGGEGGVTR
jgi:signal transduction histidine kinase